MSFSPGQEIRLYPYLLLVLLPCFMVQLGCQRHQKPSVLVIALDDFQTSDLRCTQDQMNLQGFKTLCDDFVRFTHAYTTSTLAVPAATSILTGLLPYQNSVHDNSSFLKRNHFSIAEAAYQNKYRTSFFSSGAPLFRKTGLGQGFEYFDDSISFQPDRFFKPIKENSHRFVEWLDRLDDDENFFSFIYNTDLKFQYHQTISLSGEIRSQNLESQIEEVSEVLSGLFEELQKKNRWNNTLIVITGLSGRPLNSSAFSRNQLPPPLQLHSHDMQVALFIKPPTKARDAMQTWKVDRNVSIADLAPTISEIINLPWKVSDQFFAHSFSLQSILKNQSSPKIEDRILILESGWANWHYGLPVRYAFIKNEYLYFHDENPQIYNTYIDHLEVFPLQKKDIHGSSLLKEFQNYAQKFKMAEFPTEKLFQNTANLEGIPYSAWMNTKFDKNLYSQIKEIWIENKSYEARDWLLRLALEQRNWSELEDLARNLEDGIALQTALLNLKKSDSAITDSCFILILQKNSTEEDMKKCGDEKFLVFLEYFRADSAKRDSEPLRRRVELLVQEFYIQSRITQTNYALGRLWDLSLSCQVRPHRSEFALYLPALNKVRVQTLNSLFTRRQTNQ